MGTICSSYTISLSDKCNWRILLIHLTKFLSSIISNDASNRKSMICRVILNSSSWNCHLLKRRHFKEFSVNFTNISVIRIFLYNNGSLSTCKIPVHNCSVLNNHCWWDQDWTFKSLLIEDFIEICITSFHLIFLSHS